MNHRTINRAIMGAWMLYWLVVEIWATGSFKHAVGAAASMALMAGLGWLDRDYKVGTDRAKAANVIEHGE